MSNKKLQKRIKEIISMRTASEKISYTEEKYVTCEMTGKSSSSRFGMMTLNPEDYKDSEGWHK